MGYWIVYAGMGRGSIGLGYEILHVSTCSTNNRRLSGVRDSSEPRRANARAELNLFVYLVYFVVNVKNKGLDEADIH